VAYREGLRATLNVVTDADLGFWPTRRGNTTSTQSISPPSVAAHYRGADGALVAAAPLFAPSVASSGVDPVAVIGAMAEAFQTADRRIGGGALYETVVRYLTVEISPALVNPPGGSSSAGWFSAASSVTEIAGWMAHDGGRHQQARHHFDHAYRLAVAADNSSLCANVCASLAHLAVQLQQPGDAVRIAETGLGHVARHSVGTTHLAARLRTMAARGYAMTGHAHDCLSSLDTARRLLDDSDIGPVPKWIAGFDHASLAAEAALCLHQLGRLDDAEREARQVIQLRTGDRVRSRTFGQLTLAHILADAGRVEEAATMGQAVCDTAPSLASIRALDRLAALGAALGGYRNVPEVAVFADQFARLHTAPVAGGEDVTARWPV
jgi:tetratricopeptide (TPR) repeat protein